MRIEQTIEIAAPPERVFAVLSDPTRLAEWQTSMVEVHRDGEGPLRVGERFGEVHAAFGRHVESTVEVAESEPPRTLALRIVDGPLPLDGRWTLEPHEGGTRLHFHGEARLHGLLRVAAPFGRRAIARQFGGHHRRLKQLLESEAGGRVQRWLPDGFVAPLRVELRTGEHLRPIAETDVEIDFPAVMGSRARLWAKYGEAWQWPPEDLTFEDDRKDLARHERENAAGGPFNYAVLDRDETALLGCVYIDPPDSCSAPGCDAVVSWWVVDAAVDTELEQALAAFVPAWLAETWSFGDVEYRP